MRRRRGRVGTMGLRLARFVNLLLAAVLVGNEFGTLVAIHPALNTLPTGAYIATEQAIIRRYDALMPFLMVATLLSCLPVLVLIRDRRSVAFRCALLALLAFLAMLGVTFIGNMPINQRILAASADAPPADWEQLRAEWDRWHALRNA